MKKSFQRPVGRILGLKSKTFFLSFLSQIIPDSQIITSMLSCCTATRVAAHGARHGAGRLLAVRGDIAAEALEELPQVYDGHLKNKPIQNQYNNSDATLGQY